MRNFEEKLVLTGGLKEKLEQLDKRETELLNEIARLNKLNPFNRKHSSHSLTLDKNKNRSTSSESFNTADQRSMKNDNEKNDVSLQRLKLLVFRIETKVISF